MPVRDGRRLRGVTTRPFPSSRPDIGQVSQRRGPAERDVSSRVRVQSAYGADREKQLVGDAIDWIGGDLGRTRRASSVIGLSV